MTKEELLKEKEELTGFVNLYRKIKDPENELDYDAKDRIVVIMARLNSVDLELRILELEEKEELSRGIIIKRRV